MRDTPKRVQMRRDRPWRADNPDAVIVDRRTEWGNPFTIGSRGVPDARAAVDLFAGAIAMKAWLGHNDPALGGLLSDCVGGILDVSGIQAELEGKDLACWCPLDLPCHADVLLEIANRPIASMKDGA